MYDSPSPLLLSRTAEAAYWAGRYLERAEGTARLIKAHSELLIDLPRTTNVGWSPLLALVGDESDFAKTGDTSEDNVVFHLTTNTAHTSSIRRSIGAVHRNLRVIRSVLPIEAAEVLTELYYHVEATSEEAIDRRTRGAWLNSVMRGCQTLSGILGETMTQDDAFCFFTVGRQLERADLTARVIDVQAHMLSLESNPVLAPYAAICWSAALRSVSALQAFRRHGRASTPDTILEFLIHDPKCPRTIESCLEEASRWLQEIPGHAQATAMCNEFGQRLDEANASRLVDGQLHEFADEVQVAIANLHGCIVHTWLAPVDTAAAV